MKANKIKSNKKFVDNLGNELDTNSTSKEETALVLAEDKIVATQSEVKSQSSEPSIDFVEKKDYKESYPKQKHQNHGFILPIIIVSSITVLILGIFLFGYNKLKNQENECQKIWQEVHLEMDLEKDFCKISSQKYSSIQSLYILPNLSIIKDKQQKYLQLKNEYTDTKENLQKTQAIVDTLQLKEKKLLENENDLVKYSQKIEFLNKQQKQLETDIENKINQTKVTSNVFGQKIEQAKKLNINTQKYEQLKTQVDTKQKLETLDEAKNWQQNISNLTTLSNELDIEITKANYQNSSNDKSNFAYSVNLPILMYHRIENFDSLPTNQKSRARKDLGVAQSSFAQQLDLLKSKGYETVTMRDIEKAVLTKDKKFFEGKKVMLTFDDGYKEHYEIAYPELKKRGMKGVFGIYTNNLAIGWDNLRTMNSNGMEIVSHSASHCMLASYSFKDKRQNPPGGKYQACSNPNFGFKNNNLIPQEELKYELVESRKAIEKELKIKTTYYIHTYGSYNQTTIDTLIEAGYTIGLAVGGGPNINLEKPLTLNRVTISGNDPALGGWFGGVR